MDTQKLVIEEIFKYWKNCEVFTLKINEYQRIIIKVKANNNRGNAMNKMTVVKYLIKINVAVLLVLFRVNEVIAQSCGGSYSSPGYGG